MTHQEILTLHDELEGIANGMRHFDKKLQTEQTTQSDLQWHECHDREPLEKAAHRISIYQMCLERLAERYTRTWMKVYGKDLMDGIPWTTQEEWNEQCKEENQLTMKHIIYTFKGEVYEAHKRWSLERIEIVLKRLGATYWEVGYEGKA